MNTHFKKAGPGRPPKPIAMRIADGTYDPEKHGPHVMPAEGVPQMPEGLTGDARALWELVVPTMVRHKLVGEIDAAKLTIMCEFWAEYRRSMDHVKKHSPNHPGYYNMLKTAGMANINFTGAAASFGMSPVDRARLGVDLARADEASGPQPRDRNA